ncbi:hypothetical protein [Paracoccus thiocyanatus]|uniref:hypothetical protein n=1 Tax=Paracoccus thiocyanatus TaxID=34006 RepID=UPI001CB6FA87|nr:hypothetical protein [Paracoccus thiocyanatus]
MADPLGIETGHVRMHQGRRLVGIGEFVRQFRLAGFQPSHLLLHRRVIHAIGDRIDDLGNLPADLVQFPFPTLQIGAALDAQPIHLPGELGTELLEQRGIHQMLA